MSEVEGRSDTATMMNEGEDGLISSPTVDEGEVEDKVTPPIVMSHEKGTDPIEPVISEGEIQHEGKGKGRAESFSHLPAHGDSAPSTAPTTRPVSQDALTEPSTAGSTPPISPTQGDLTPPVSPAQGDSTPPVSPAQAESTPTASPAQGDPNPITGQNALPLNLRMEHDCGCADIYDHTGKKRQQACDRHKLNPIRSMLPLPPKLPLSETTNLTGGGPRIPLYTPQAQRNEESPPRRPPVEIPLKGRNFVQASENGPTFLDPFNSERAIEPTGPPNTLTTIPTQEDMPLKEPKKPTVRVSDPPKASEPKTLKPILKKTVGTAAEARQAERSRSLPDQVNNDEPQDNSGGVRRLPAQDNREGVKLFQETVGRLKAGEGNSPANNGEGPARGDQGAGPMPPTLVLDTGAGLVKARTNSNDVPVFAAPPGEGSDNSSSVDEGMMCGRCVLS